MLMLQMMRTPFSHTHENNETQNGQKELQFKTEYTLYIRESGCFPTSRQFAAFSYMHAQIDMMCCVVAGESIEEEKESYYRCLPTKVPFLPPLLCANITSHSLTQISPQKNPVLSRQVGGGGGFHAEDK